MNTTQLRSLMTCALLALIAPMGCSKVASLLGKDEGKADASPVASASAAAPDLRAADESSVCASSERKVWGKWANRRTGLTPRKHGSGVAVGVGIGNKPHVLVFDAQGGGRLQKVELAEGSELVNDLPVKQGRRDLQRVTPVERDGKLTAYVDYRDKHESKRRRVACELASTKQAVLLFDDKPLLERDQDKPKDKPKQDAGAPVAQASDGGAPKLASNSARKLRMPKAAAIAAAAGKPAASADAGVEPAKPALKEAKKKLRELRDCRTFVDADGEAWGLGSELVGEVQADESVKWSMRLFVAPNAGTGYAQLENLPLPAEPKELHTFEAPSAAELPDGSHAIAARYRGSLMTWLLDAELKPTGRAKTYRGGWPTISELVPDAGGLLLLTSRKVADDRYELAFGRIGASGLPAALTKPTIDGVDPSLAEPTLASSGDQRWLAVNAGSKRQGQLLLVPVDSSLRATGRPHEVTARGTSVYEARVVALSGGRLLALYIESAKDGDELVSQVLSCTVKA